MVGLLHIFSKNLLLLDNYTLERSAGYTFQDLSSTSLNTECVECDW